MINDVNICTSVLRSPITLQVCGSYLATINLLHCVQEFVETGLHIITLDLHHVQSGGEGVGEPALRAIVCFLPE